MSVKELITTRPEQDQVLTTKELARRWKISEAALGTMRFRNKGPKYRKYGGSIRYKLSDIEAYELEVTHSTQDQS